jgi:TonB family protein
MSAGAQARGWQGQSRRRSPRFHLNVPVDVTVLRSGIPQAMPGRCLNLGERGVAGVIAGELVPGEIVGVELRLPVSSDWLRTRARVCYQDELCCGLEFLGLSAQQRAAIGEWAERTKAKVEAERDVAESDAKDAAGMEREWPKELAKKEQMRRKRGRAAPLWGVLVLLISSAGAAVFWWQWNRGWKQLESGLRGEETSAQAASVQVPAEVMERLLVHRVEPVYPLEAKKQGLEGVIALDVVVGRDGSVVSMHALNGPGILARAAMDALRWWHFEPYRVNGEPAAVETTLAVEFKR